MRHGNTGRKLGRKAQPRRALRRHVVCSLFTHGRIETTISKAKEFRPWAERMITIAKRGAAARAAGDTVTALNAYRRLLAELHDEPVVAKLIGEIGPAFADRPGGYTRMLRTAKPRLGDNATTVVFELVTFDADAAAATKAAARAARGPKRASDASA
ncbi:MAG: 50S ribosomal protein L17 [Planctomycetes bacterium]|nr:50S ribosomal protein L17 [Planctomycetota bacterium]